MEVKRVKRNFVGTVLSLTLVAGVAGMLLFAAGSASAQAAQTDPTSVLMAFEQAVGTNVDAAVALVTDDAVLKIVPPPAGTTGLWTGKDQVQQALEYSLAHKVSRQIMGTPQVDGNKVTALAMVTNDAFQHL